MQNGTMIQFFHWYTPSDGNFWKHVTAEAKKLAAMGITAAWLPPASKGSSGTSSVGYDVYDLYDLGEFEQKGTTRTKYGTREEFLDAIAALQGAGIQFIADIVLNHMGGGDETEKMMAVKVEPENRNEAISEPVEIEAYTKFTFPGRNRKYSDFIWDFQCFSGVDYDAKLNETGIFSILNECGDGWEEMIDEEKGNYDYLMFCDIDSRNPFVREELAKWAKWYYDTTTFDGVRLDAVKHISPRFYNEWLDRLRADTGKEIFAVAEYWAPGSLPTLLKYIEATEGRVSLFDAALHHNLHHASVGGKDFDLTTILNDTLVQAMPHKTVTVVENHDTQPLQALEAPVETWFKPLAYALILLREAGYPCVFYADVYGTEYTDKGSDGNEYHIVLARVEELQHLLEARSRFAYGVQRDYFDHPNCIGWTREGDEEHSGCAVLLSNGDDANKSMEIGKRYAGAIFIDLLGKNPAEVTVNEDGVAEFYANAGSVSVWVQKN